MAFLTFSIALCTEGLLELKSNYRDKSIVKSNMLEKNKIKILSVYIYIYTTIPGFSSREVSLDALSLSLDVLNCKMEDTNK